MSSPKATAGKRAPAGKNAAARKPAARAAPRLVVTDAAHDDASDQAKRLAAEINKSLSRGDTNALTPEALQALTAAVCRLYSAQTEAGGQHLPLGARSGVTATDVMNVASGLLKAVNLAVFELGMWQSWTGR